MLSCFYSTIKSQIKPVLDKLNGDADADVKYFAQEALTGTVSTSNSIFGCFSVKSKDYCKCLNTITLSVAGCRSPKEVYRTGPALFSANDVAPIYDSQILNKNNTGFIYIPLFLSLSTSALQMTEVSIKCLKIPIGRRQTSWLFTQRSRIVESRATENKSSEWQGGGIEPRITR